MTSFSGGRSRREPPTMDTQLVNFINCGASRVHPSCNLQSRARTHAVLLIGLYELLGNPATVLIDPPGPFPTGCCYVPKNVLKDDMRRFFKDHLLNSLGLRIRRCCKMSEYKLPARASCELQCINSIREWLVYRITIKVWNI